MPAGLLSSFIERAGALSATIDLFVTFRLSQVRRILRAFRANGPAREPYAIQKRHAMPSRCGRLTGGGDRDMQRPKS